MGNCYSFDHIAEDHIHVHTNTVMKYQYWDTLKPLILNFGSNGKLMVLSDLILKGTLIRNEHSLLMHLTIGAVAT